MLSRVANNTSLKRLLVARGTSATTTNNAAAASVTTAQRCWASTLIVSEPLLDDGATPAAVQSAVTAAKHLGNSEMNLLVVGGPPPSQIPEGISKVYHVTGNGVDATSQSQVIGETVAAAVQATAAKDDCNVVVGTSTKFGSSIVPRAAALLDVSPVTDILEIQDASELQTCGVAQSFLFFLCNYIHFTFQSHFLS